MDLPIEGTITSGYGNRTDPRSGNTKFHSGIDIGAVRGTPVNANVTGVIEYAGYKGDYGNVVFLRTGDILQTFAHLDSLAVKTGQQVDVGKKLGEVGSTGYSTGNHLHWAIQKDGEYTNPEKFNVTFFDEAKNFLNNIFSTPQFLGGTNIFDTDQIKYDINYGVLNIILVLVVIVFTLFAFFPTASKEMISSVKQKI